LTAPLFEIGPNGIKVESKEDVCKRLGRSTDRGDAVVMAWAYGDKIQNQRGGWPATNVYMGGPGEMGLERRRPQVVMSRTNVRIATGRWRSD
jgi:hypothetical protein